MPTRRSVLKSLAATTLSLKRSPRAVAQIPEAPLHDPLRPAFHYLPARNWMNDPCGPIYYQGQYHLFHQYNPHTAVWGDMHWAHAVSPDMVHWTRLPIALAPTPGGPDAQGCFTGTAVLDHGRPTFLYTGVQNAVRAESTLIDPNTSMRETQCLAVATDDTLGTWKKLSAPVIPNPPAGMRVTGFRDPSPWREGDTWYTIVGSGIAGKGGMVLLYRSPDLRSWEYLHPLFEGKWTGIPSSNPVDSGEMWECPELFPLKDEATGQEKHLLIYSTEGKVIWRSGTLDRAVMRFLPEKRGELDYGRKGTDRVTFYAPKTQLDARGNRILWGWVAETRPESEYSKAGWSGLMALPRLLTLRDGELSMEPAAQVARLRKAAAHTGEAHEFLLTLQPATGSAQPIELADATGKVLSVHSNSADETHTLRFTSDGGANQIAVPLAGPLAPGATLHAFIDNSVLEIFIDKRVCYTHRFYTRDAAQSILTLTLPGQWRAGAQQTFALDRIWPT